VRRDVRQGIQQSNTPQNQISHLCGVKTAKWLKCRHFFVEFINVKDIDIVEIIVKNIKIMSIHCERPCYTEWDVNMRSVIGLCLCVSKHNNSCNHTR
jgi:hypothetical protein